LTLATKGKCRRLEGKEAGKEAAKRENKAAHDLADREDKNAA